MAALEGDAAVPEALGWSYCPQVSPETKPSPLGRAVETKACGAGQSCSLSALHASAHLPSRTPRCPRLPRVLTPQRAPDPTSVTPGARMRLKAVRREPSGQAGMRHGFCLQQPLPQPAVRVPRKGSPRPDSEQGCGGPSFRAHGARLSVGDPQRRCPPGPSRHAPHGPGAVSLHAAGGGPAQPTRRCPVPVASWGGRSRFRGRAARASGSGCYRLK